MICFQVKYGFLYKGYVVDSVPHSTMSLLPTTVLHTEAFVIAETNFDKKTRLALLSDFPRRTFREAYVRSQMSVKDAIRFVSMNLVFKKSHIFRSDKIYCFILYMKNISGSDNKIISFVIISAIRAFRQEYPAHSTVC